MSVVVHQACEHAAGAEALDALAEATARLELPLPHERRSLLLEECARLVDGLLVRVARGRSALDVALGEVLDQLSQGDCTLRLGFSGLADYARERLGIAGRTAQGMAHLARALRTRPLLRAAVWSGEVGTRKAELLLPAARGEAEAAWVARARVSSVRALAAAVRAQDPEPEEWERLALDLTPAAAAALEEALALAGRVLGPTAPRWERLEAICQEYLGAHPSPGEAGQGEAGVPPGSATSSLDAVRAALEEEMDGWSFLEAVPAAAAPAVAPSCDALALDAEARRLASLRRRWDELLGRLSLLLRGLGLWRTMGFASLSHYAAERLGLAARTVEQRASLERRLVELPALRRALREGLLSYEQARLVASAADDATVEGWIARARGLSCVALRREVEAGEEPQMCALAALRLRVPRQVAGLLAAALEAARLASGRWLRPCEALEVVARHFVDTWKGMDTARATPQRRALARDGGLCQVPGCSRAAVHAHHVLHRARGGGDEAGNLVALCAPHHLRGVHGGHLRVHGVAPGALRWRLVGGERLRAPLYLPTLRPASCSPQAARSPARARLSASA